MMTEPVGFAPSSGVTSRTAARMVILTSSLHSVMQGGESAASGVSGRGSSKKLSSFGSRISVKFARLSSNSSSTRSFR